LKNNEREKNESPNPEMPAAFHQSSQPKNGQPRNKLSPEHKRSDESTMRLAARPGRDPKVLDLPAVDYVSEHETNSSSA
jgi:hypothetical protein